MHRLNQAFLAVVLVLSLFGGVAVADYSSGLGTLKDAGLVESQVETTVISGAVTNETFTLEVRVENPTRFDLQLNGAYMALSNGNERVAYGSIVNHDELPPGIPPKDSVRIRYELALSQHQAEELRAALEDGPVEVAGRHGVQLEDTSFSIEFTGEVGSE